jgi:hypothetical protein
MSIKAGELDRAWEKLGFQVDDKRRDVHARLWVEGVLILSTRRSHGAGKLDGKIPYFIRQQMKLSEDQFSQAIACPLGRDDYLAILKGKGAIP